MHRDDNRLLNYVDNFITLVTYLKQALKSESYFVTREERAAFRREIAELNALLEYVQVSAEHLPQYPELLGNLTHLSEMQKSVLNKRKISRSHIQAVRKFFSDQPWSRIEGVLADESLLKEALGGHPYYIDLKYDSHSGKLFINVLLKQRETWKGYTIQHHKIDNFIGSINFESCEFRAVNILQSAFSGNFKKCDFSGLLEDVTFTGNLTACTFNRIRGVRLSFISSSLTKCHFYSCKLSFLTTSKNSRMTGGSLNGTVEGFSLEGSFDAVDFSDSKWHGKGAATKFVISAHKCTFDKAIFQNTVDLSGFTSCSFKKSTFKKSDMRCHFRSCDLSESDFKDCDIKSMTTFLDSVLYKVNFHNSELRNTKVLKARSLTRVRFPKDFAKEHSAEITARQEELIAKGGRLTVVQGRSGDLSLASEGGDLSLAKGKTKKPKKPSKWWPGNWFK